VEHHGKEKLGTFGGSDETTILERLSYVAGTEKDEGPGVALDSLLQAEQPLGKNVDAPTRGIIHHDGVPGNPAQLPHEIGPIDTVRQKPKAHSGIERGGVIGEGLQIGDFEPAAAPIQVTGESAGARRISADDHYAEPGIDKRWGHLSMPPTNVDKACLGRKVAEEIEYEVCLSLEEPSAYFPGETTGVVVRGRLDVSGFRRVGCGGHDFFSSSGSRSGPEFIA
jgi:hypothetical protein